MPLADTGIKKAKPRQRPYSMGDGGGLYLWLTTAGGKLWRWSYQYEGKEKLMSLGKYPDVSLGQARERHREARKLLAEGVDPMAQRTAAKTAEKAAVENSFQSITTPWLEHWQDGKSPRHVDYVKRRLEADILPSWALAP
ncbi:MAG: Arm DNA-binding domain-containing protein [Acidobacteriaceae bacterium]